MDPNNKPVHDLVLDLSSFQLIRAGKLVKLEKTPMELLTLLVRRRGMLVTREEIVAIIWGDGVHVDVGAGINTAIRKIRQALDDDAEAPRYLETVIGKGYRFVGDIEVVDPEGLVSGAAAAPARRNTWIWVSSLILAALVVLLVIRFASRPTASAVSRSNPGPVVIGVAGLQNLSPDAGQDYFAAGLTDDVLTQLGQLNPGQLRVIRYDSPAGKGNTNRGSVDPIQQQGMQYVLEGSVRREQKQARVSVRLVRVADGSTLWAESFDRQVGDVLSLQSEVAQRIGRQLQVQVLGHAVTKTANPEVVEAYLRGRFELSRHKIPVPDVVRLSFERAIALDPAYAPAYAGLADFYRSSAVSSDQNAVRDWPPAEQNANRALALDSENAEAHAALAQIKLQRDWDWRGAREHALRALQLNPSLPEAHIVYARYLRIAGNMTEAVNQRKQAVALDPLRTDLTEMLVLEYYFARDHTSAVAAARQMLANESDTRFAHDALCANLGRLNLFDDAVAECSQSLRQDGHADWVAAYLREYHRHGYEAASVLIGTKYLKEILRKPHPDLWDLANAYVQAGKREETIQTLGRGLAIRDPGLLQIRVDPEFDPIRSDPRYSELVRKIGFPTE